MAPHIANFLLGSFGIVAAVLLIGGSIFLRAQKNRQRFELMKRALDSGTPLPEGPPLWLASRRQALSIFAVGIGLIVVGCGGWWVGSGATMPDAATVAMAQAATQPAVNLAEPIHFGRDPSPPRPPVQSPEIEAWHSAQERVAVGQTALGSGIILTLLGLVRLSYTATEKRVTDRALESRPSI